MCHILPLCSACFSAVVLPHMKSPSLLLLAFKIPTRNRQELLPPHLSFLLSMLLRFYRSFLSYCLFWITTPLPPPPPLPLLLSALCDSLAAVWCIVEMLDLQLCASRMTIPVETVGKYNRTASHPIKRSPQSWVIASVDFNSTKLSQGLTQMFVTQLSHSSEVGFVKPRKSGWCWYQPFPWMTSL